MECRYSRVALYSSEPRSSVSKVEAISLISPASASVSTVTRSALSSLARDPFRCLLTGILMGSPDLVSHKLC